MFSFDPRSIIVTAGFTAAVMAAVLLLMRHNYPRWIHGLAEWGLASLLWLLASLLFAGRGSLPDFWTTTAANTLLFLGGATYYIGTRRFLGHAPHHRIWLGVAVLLLASLQGLAWQLPDPQHYPLRLMVSNLAQGSLYLAQLVFLVRHGGAHFSVRFVQAGLCLHLGVLGLRLLTVATGQAEHNLLAPSVSQMLYLSVYALTTLMLSLGAVLMATERLRRELEHVANHDSLTQVLNRMALLRICEDELSRATRHGKGPALMMIDLDHFKHVNDTHGHQHGDRVLQHFARRTQEVLRAHDKLGRYGGEEFMVLLPECCTSDAQVVAQRIHHVLSQGQEFDCKASIGVTCWSGCGDSLSNMLSRADAALYRAKANGRDQTQLG